MDRFRAVLLTLSVLALLPTACAQSSAPVPVATPPEISPSPQPTLSEMKARAVAYADSVKSLSDANMASFSSHIGVTLVPAPGIAGSTSGNLPLLDGHLYFAYFGSSGAGDGLPMHTLGFVQASGTSFTESPRAECIWEEEGAGRALEEVGFHRGGEWAFQRGRLQRYWRDVTETGSVFDASLMTYTVKSGAGEKTCVYAIRYTGGEK